MLQSSHQITQPGNNRQDVSLSDEDRHRCQQLLPLHLRACRVGLLGWCWMTNHVHMIAVPQREDSFAQLIRRLHSSYAQHFDRRHGRDGHLCEVVFYSCALDPAHLDAALLYVDLKPLRAGIKTEAAAWRWSSVRGQTSGRDESGLLDWLSLDRWGGCADWAATLAQGQDTKTAERILTATRSGKPFGGEDFQKSLEPDLGMPKAGSRGRPRGDSRLGRVAASSQ